ncbi:hypothetical protein FBUS_05720 [Fasciolopsis buskii]|uniref:Uncharacterized protein n=1 Tax=Fasciolopsis buskii TaxID=27845 RepID=A0A8E0VMK7_9TREM|nr:hypothetical protein FBUS_05720 [Fasciolopsis buski]
MRKCKAPKCRYIVAFVLFLYLNVNYMIRVDINITLLSMVNDTSDRGMEQNITTVCGTKKVVDRSEKHSVGTYLWNRPIQGLILGAFFWGYIFVQIPACLSAPGIIPSGQSTVFSDIVELMLHAEYVKNGTVQSFMRIDEVMNFVAA